MKRCTGYGKQGFTLVEVVVAVALLAVITASAIPVTLGVSRAYASVTQQNLLQNKAANTMDVIRQSIGNASAMRITAPPDAAKLDAGYRYIWCEKSTVRYTNSDGKVATLYEDTRFRLRFTATGNRLDIFLTALGDGEKGYDLESSVYLQNAGAIATAAGQEQSCIRWSSFS